MKMIDMYPAPTGNSITRLKLVQGIGKNDWNGSIRNDDGSVWKVYEVWTLMLQRCYSHKFQEKNPTYVGCSVCEEWLSFSTFADWFLDQEYVQDGQLDKDLLVYGNTVYSPSTCLIVPLWLNSLTTCCDAARGKYPIGVCWYKQTKRLKVQMSFDGKSKHLGYFPLDQITEACKTYTQTKSDYIKSKEQEIEKIYPGLTHKIQMKVIIDSYNSYASYMLVP